MKRPRAPSKQSRKAPPSKKTKSGSKAPAKKKNPRAKKSTTTTTTNTTVEEARQATKQITKKEAQQLKNHSQESDTDSDGTDKNSSSPSKRQKCEESSHTTAGKPLGKKSRTRVRKQTTSTSRSDSEDDNDNEPISGSDTHDSSATSASPPSRVTTTAQGSPTPVPRTQQSTGVGNEVEIEGGEHLLKSFDTAVANKATALASIKESMANSAAQEEAVRSLLQRRIVTHAQLDAIQYEMASSEELVKLNVGGEYFTIPRRTLISRDSESFFTLLLNAGGRDSKIPCFKDSTGALFIDRDPKIFRYILNYLRGYKRFQMLSSEILDLIKADAQYYQLDGLLKLIQGLLPPLQMQFHTGPGVNPERNRIRVVYGVSFLGERFLISGKHRVTYEILRSDYVGIGIVSDACKYTDQEFHKTPNCCVYYMTGVFYTNFPHHKKEEFMQKLENGDFITLAIDMDKRVAEITLKNSTKVFSLGNAQRLRFAVVMKLGSRVRIVPEEEAAKLPMIRKKYYPHLCDSVTESTGTAEAESGTGENRITNESGGTSAINVAGESESQREQIRNNQSRTGTGLPFPETEFIVSQGVTPPTTPATTAAPFDPFGIPSILPESGRTGGSTVAYGIPLSMQLQARVRPSPTTLPRLDPRQSFRSFEGSFGGEYVVPFVGRTTGTSTTVLRTAGDSAEQSQQGSRGNHDAIGTTRVRGVVQVVPPDTAPSTGDVQQSLGDTPSLDLLSGRRAVVDAPQGIRPREPTNHQQTSQSEQRQSQSQPFSQGAEGAGSNIAGRQPDYQGFLGSSNAMQYVPPRRVGDENLQSSQPVSQTQGDRGAVGVPTAMSTTGERTREPAPQTDNAQLQTTTSRPTGDDPSLTFRTANELAGEEEDNETETLWLPVPPRSSRPS